MITEAKGRDSYILGLFGAVVAGVSVRAAPTPLPLLVDATVGALRLASEVIDNKFSSFNIRLLAWNFDFLRLSELAILWSQSWAQ